MATIKQNALPCDLDSPQPLPAGKYVSILAGWVDPEGAPPGFVHLEITIDNLLVARREIPFAPDNPLPYRPHVGYPPGYKPPQQAYYCDSIAAFVPSASIAFLTISGPHKPEFVTLSWWDVK